MEGEQGAAARSRSGCCNNSSRTGSGACGAGAGLGTVGPLSTRRGSGVGLRASGDTARRAEGAGALLLARGAMAPLSTRAGEAWRGGGGGGGLTVSSTGAGEEADALLMRDQALTLWVETAGGPLAGVHGGLQSLPSPLSHRSL